MTTLTDGITLVLLIGAANADATPEQRQLLREKIEAPMALYVETGDETLVWMTIQDIMGATWAPTGEWGQYITSLTNK